MRSIIFEIIFEMPCSEQRLFLLPPFVYLLIFLGRIFGSLVLPAFAGTLIYVTYLANQNREKSVPSSWHVWCLISCVMYAESGFVIRGIL